VRRRIGRPCLAAVLLAALLPASAARAAGLGGVGAVDSVRSEVPWSAGGGFRYLLARSFGLRTGLDLARGPEEWAIYVVFGNAWR
jgi:hypothetical protein